MSEQIIIILLTCIGNGLVTYGVVRTQIAWLRKDVDWAHRRIDQAHDRIDNCQQTIRLRQHSREEGK